MKNLFKNAKKEIHLTAEKKAIVWENIEKELFFSEKNVRIE